MSINVFQFFQSFADNQGILVIGAVIIIVCIAGLIEDRTPEKTNK